MSVEELQQRVDALTNEVKAIAQKIGIDDLDNFDPNDVEALEQLSALDQDEDLNLNALGRVGEFLQSISWTTTRGLHYCDALIQKTPQDRVPYDKAASSSIIIPDLERAATYLQLMAERFEEQRGEALRSLAIILSQLVEEADDEGLFDRADRYTRRIEQTLRDAIAADNALEGYTLLAGALLAQGNREKEKEVEGLLRQAQQLAKTSEEEALVEASFGRLAVEREEHQQALHHFQRASELNPKEQGIWADLGHEQRLLHDYPAAERSLSRSIEEEPQFTEAYIDLAYIYTETNRIKAARELLEIALDDNAEDPELLAALALTYLRSGNIQTAEELLEEAEEIDDSSEFVREVHAELEVKRAQRQMRGKQSSSKNNSRRKKR